MIDFPGIANKYRDEIYSDLRRLVDANSFTQNLDGINEVAKMLQGMASRYHLPFEAIMIQTEDGEQRPHLLYRSSHERGYFALVGHFDTVHAPESDFSRLLDQGEKLVGPGVNDMKAGVLVALYSMVVLQELLPLKDIPVRILFNADEEIGSPGSRKIIDSSLSQAVAAFVFEPGRWPGNQIVTERKGKWSLDVEVFGQPSHAGDAPKAGANAIVAAANIISQLNALNDHDDGSSVVCSMVSGGVAKNVVPDYCCFSADIRVPAQLASKIRAAVEQILLFKHKDLKISYCLEERRPPLLKRPDSEKFFHLYRQVSEKYGLPCEEVSTGGVSDANLLSSYGIPCLDGLGAVGQFPHTKKEYIIAESLFERTVIFSDFFYQLLSGKQL